MAKSNQRRTIATSLVFIKLKSMTTSKFMDINSLTEYIPLTKSTIYSMVCRKQIPFKKIGKKLIFNKLDIDNWINNGGKNTKEENIPSLFV